MRFLYKIYSGYDGFTPACIPERVTGAGLLSLGWRQYVDAVEIGHEVWVYFHGPHAFVNGVYVRGIVEEVDADYPAVLLRVAESDADQPLTSAVTAERIAAVVAPRGRQVFVLPEEWEPGPSCDIADQANTCAEKNCEFCPAWQSVPLIDPANQGSPPRLDAGFPFQAGYWVIPARCLLHRLRGAIVTEVRRSSELFYRFKLGERALAHPLALGLFHALRGEDLLGWDLVVPIPLSPDKASAGELHRTRALSRELARMMGTPMLEAVGLTEPMSKRRLRAEGVTQLQYERRYRDALEVDARIADYGRILLVDDVVTSGGTLAAASAAVSAVDTNITVGGACAGQMITRHTVVDPTLLMEG